MIQCLFLVCGMNISFSHCGSLCTVSAKGKSGSVVLGSKTLSLKKVVRAMSKAFGSLCSGLAVCSIPHTLVKYLITGSMRLELLLLATTELSSNRRRVQAGRLCSTLARAGVPSALYDKDRVFRCAASVRQKNFCHPVSAPVLSLPTLEF